MFFNVIILTWHDGFKLRKWKNNFVTAKTIFFSIQCFAHVLQWREVSEFKCDFLGLFQANIVLSASHLSPEDTFLPPYLSLDLPLSRFALQSLFMAFPQLQAAVMLLSAVCLHIAPTAQLPQHVGALELQAALNACCESRGFSLVPLGEVGGDRGEFPLLVCAHKYYFSCLLSLILLRGSPRDNNL